MSTVGHKMTEGSSGALQSAARGGSLSSPGMEQPPWEATPSYVSDRGDNAGRLLEYYRILRKHLGLLAVLTALGVLLAWLLTLPLARIYRATTSVEVLRVNEDFLGARAVNPNSSLAGEFQPEYDIQTQKGVLQSRSVIERALAKDNIEPRLLASAEKASQSGWFAVLRLLNARSSPLGHEQALSMTTDGLTVKSQQNSRVLEITVNSMDPQLSSDLANAITASYSEWSIERRWSTNQYTREWMSKQLADLKSQLQQSEGRLLSFAQTSGFIFTSEKDNVDDQRLRYFQEELGKATVDRVSKQSRFDLSSNVPPESLPEVLEDHALQSYQAELTTLRQQLAELSASFTREYPKVTKIEAQIKEVTAAYVAATSAELNRIRNEYVEARTRENLLASKYDAQAKLMSRQTESVAQYDILRRELETTRALYESLLQKSKESDILTAMKTSNIQVVDPARPPKTPYRPNLPLNLSFGLLSGFLLGVGIILVPEQGQRVRDPGDAEFFLSLPELGVIPSGNQKSDHARRLPSFSGSRSLSLMKGGPRNEMTILQNRASPFADSFHDTLISILYARKNGVAPQVIAVSSANPREGKTTVVSNLAIALAELNKRVLLVDGDTRKSRLHTIFQIDKTPGVSEVLSGQSTPVLRETKVPNLVVLPAGAGVDPSALFGPRLGDLFTHLRERFDVILVDTPSILNLPDARMFALESDAAILVIRAGLSTRDSIQFACRRLQEGGSWLLGAILNDWNPRSSGHRYGYGYGEYYGEAKQERHI